jgi:hypothetical protein
VSSERGGHPGAGKMRVATVVRSVPVRLVEVSRGGCRFECASRLQSGTSGLLAVALGGLMRADDFRVARCQQRIGASDVYQVGAEFLRTRRLGRRTVRMAVARIAGHVPDMRHIHAPADHPTSAGDGHRGESTDRGPPVRSDSEV